MAKQTVNIGQQANDGSGDGLRTGGDKINDNFNEIYSILGDGSNLLNTDIDFGPNKIFHSNSIATVNDLSNINPSTYPGLLVHVAGTGAIYYAHAGSWKKLLSDASSDNISGYADPLDAVAYSGNYNDLGNRPNIPSSLTDIGIVDGSAGQVLSTDGTGNFTFRDITATSIDFSNVTNKPTTLAGYGINDAFTGRYDDLIDKPVLFSGDYNDLTNKPTIATDIQDLTDTTNLLFDGDYNSLANRPVLPTDVSDLTDNTNLFFSRSYDDLTDKPTFFQGLTAIGMSLGVTIDEFSNDTNMTDNSATALVTERAVRSYVLNQIGGLSIPTDLTDLNIVDGTSGQVLTTDGLGGFTFQDPGDQIGNFTLAASVIDTDDSSAITITPAVIMSSDLNVENTLTTNDLVVTGTVSTFGDGDPELLSESSISLTAPTGVIISNDIIVGGTATVSGDTTVGGVLTVGGSIIPDTDITYDLGTVTNRFRDLYLSGSTIQLGNTTISAAGGSLSIGSPSIQVTGFYDQIGELVSERTSVTLKSGGYGPYTQGAVIYDSILFDPVQFPTPFDGQTRPVYSTTTAGDNVTAITGILDGGSYLFDGGGDDYILFINSADPQNEPYVANGAGFAVFVNILNPQISNGTYTATYTSDNSETLSINYTVSGDQVTVNSIVQSGSFNAGEIPDHPSINGYSEGETWSVTSLDPTALYFGNDSSAPEIQFYLGSNINGTELLDSSGNSVFINLEAVNTPTNQTAKTLSVSNIINIGTSTVPPVSPQDGDIALADGINWDPVSTGKKTLVIYLSGAWIQIAVAP